MGLARLLRAELKIICAVFLISLIAGAAFYALQPEKYEVSMLVESRLSTIGPYSANLPWSVKELVDSGVLAVEASKKAGMSGVLLPRFGATVCSPSQILRIYTFVPRKDVEAAKKVMLALFLALAEKFPKDNEQYFLELEGLVEILHELDGRLLKLSSNMKADAGSGDLRGVKDAISKMRVKVAELQAEGSSLHGFGLRVITSPEAAEVPSTPALAEVLLSFGLIGLFAGLSAALSRVSFPGDRSPARTNPPEPPNL